jgi:hypothetical protein
MPPSGGFRIYFGYPYPGAVKGIGLTAKRDYPVRVSLGQGAERDHRMTKKPYIVKELQGDANQAA